MVHGPKLNIAASQGLLQKFVPEVGVRVIEFGKLNNIVHVECWGEDIDGS
jgi:hypothetical protein